LRDALQNFGSPLFDFDKFFKLHVVCVLHHHQRTHVEVFLLFQAEQEGGVVMPELMFQQMLQLFVCCIYFKPEVAAPGASFATCRSCAESQRFAGAFTGLFR
jgi:hypothetical protein